MHLLKKSVYTFLGLLFLLFFFVLWKNDPSMTPVNPVVIPEVIDKEFKQRPLVVLVSYADGHEVFFRNQQNLSASASDKGFDIIYNYRRGQIDPEFYKKNKEILELPRGAGYWLWKPYFILKTMNELPDNSIIFYLDSGVFFKKPITKILELLKKYDMVLVGYGKPIPLGHQLKKEAYQALPLPVTPDILMQQALWGTFLFIKNTKETREFISKWLKACENKDALTDTPLDPKNQIPHFGAHLHDQALLSALLAMYPENKFIIPRDVLRKTYGIHNFHRHPHVAFTSPFFLMASVPQWISRFLWDNYLMTSLRKLFF